MLDKIICVDDDIITLMLCKKVIEKANFAEEIIACKNGEEAMNYFDSLSLEAKSTNTAGLYPKLVFLDEFFF